jgi:glutaredoxin
MTSKPVIKVFSRPVCNYCTQAKELLSNKYQVTPDQFFEMIGKTVRTVPQITWDDELIGGFTDLREKLLNEGLLKFDDVHG